MSTYDDPNREAVGQPPIWTGAGAEPEPETSRSEPEPTKAKAKAKDEPVEEG